MRAEGQDRHVLALLQHDRPLPISSTSRVRAWSTPTPRRADSGSDGPGRHARRPWRPCAQLRLIGGGHHGEPGQVRPDRRCRTRPHGSRHRRPPAPRGRWRSARAGLQRHVMHDLVVAALQEGRIDRAEGFQPARRHARGKGDAVLFGDAHVEDPGRENAPPSGRDPVPDGIAAVTATIRGSRAASSPGAPEDGGVAGRVRAPSSARRSATSNFATPWYLSSLVSAGA
jgi:hypothetical protein